MVRNVVPSWITLSGLFLAFWSLTLTVDGRYEAAAWVILAAAMTDVVDGALARILGSVSPFGKQLDSLVDLVAAGVAPAFLVYNVYFDEAGGWGVLAAFAWVALVAIRLARFNTASLVGGRYFVGVPCPPAGTAVAQYLLFSRATFGNDGYSWVVASMIVVLGALMLSRVPYWKSSTLMPRSFFRYFYGPGLLTMVLVAIPFPNQAFFLGAAGSVIVAVGIHLVRLLRFDRDDRLDVVEAIEEGREGPAPAVGRDSRPIPGRVG
jgi:CDP-diacylglycerol---serine O-phosphatidyltransferase